MRIFLALIILSGVAFGLFAAHAQTGEGEADLSSSWRHEPGFPTENEARSKAQVFLDAVRPEDFNRLRKPAFDHTSESKSERPQEP